MPEADIDSIRRLWSQTIRDRGLWEPGDPTLTYKPEPEEPPAGITVDRPGAVVATPSALPIPVTDEHVATGVAGVSGITIAGPGALPTKTTIVLPPVAPGKPATPIPVDPGDFELIEKIGEGGMGVVWRAQQQSLAREVAVKKSKFDPRDVNARFYAEHFVAEARVTGFLDHPNIVPVHAIGQDASGSLFLSMKLVQGTSWRDLLHPPDDSVAKRAAAYDLEAHLGILVSVCNAVAFAHSRGFAHLDLKPANVMVGDYGEVLVMDWGIAVDISELPSRQDAPAPPEPRRARHHTAVLAPAGTPAYLAPEMAQGRGPDIGPWTDVYLLGAILHEVITGEPPHRGESISDVLWNAIHSDPKTYGRDVPQALGDICRRAMAREIGRRYQSVSEFQDALRTFLKYRQSMHIADRAGHEIAKLSGPDVRYRDVTKRFETYADGVSRYRQALELWEGNEVARAGLRAAAVGYCGEALAAGDLGLASAQLEILPWEDPEARTLRDRVEKAREQLAHKERAQLLMRRVAGALAAIVFVGITVGFFWIRSERDVAFRREKEATAARLGSESERRKAVAQREQAQREADKSKAVLSFLQRMLSSAAPEHGGRDVRVLDMLDTADAQIRDEFGDRPEIRTTIQHSIGQTFLGLGEFARAEEHFSAAATVRAEKLGPDDPDTLESLFQLANVHWKRGEHADAERMLTDVAARRARVLGAEHRDTLRTNAALAMLALHRGDGGRAERMLRETLEVQQRVLGPRDRDALDTMFDLSAALRTRDRSDEAQEVLKRLLDAELDAFAEKNPGILPNRTSAQSAINIQRRLLETEGGLRAWLSHRTPGAESGAESSGAENVADVLRSLGKGSEAARLCRDIITVRVRLLGADHPRTLSAMEDLGATLLDEGSTHEAETMLRAVVTGARRVLGERHPDTLRYQRGLARVLVATARLDEAQALLTETLGTLNITLGLAHPETLCAAYDLATVAFVRKDYAAAEDLLQSVVERAGSERLTTIPGISDAPARLDEARRAREAGAGE